MDLQDKFKLSVRIEDGSSLTEKQIEDCDSVELLTDWLEQVNRAIISINNQLDAAMGDFHQTHRRADSDWFRRTKGAKRSFGFISQKLQQRIKAVKAKLVAELTAEKEKNFDRAFVKSAKTLLPPEVFMQVVELTIISLKSA